MTPPVFDVAVVGGGIVGAACAAACAREGMRVALVERDVIGGGATAAGMGHVVVMDDSEAQFALTHVSQLLWAELARELPDNCEYECTGTLWVAADEEEMAEAERKLAYYRERGVGAELLDASALAEAEPNLRDGLTGALFVPGDAVVYPPTVAVYLARAAESAGATLLAGTRVVHIADGSLQCQDGRELKAAKIVDATGTWATDLHPEIPVRKRKGHLVITDRYPGFVRHQLVELGYLKSAHSVGSDSVAFNAQPRRTGQILIGSSRQYGSEEGAVEQHMLTAMLERAVAYMPGIASLQAIRTWTGFRAATPDKLPLIGPSAEDASVWLATGHEGLGITTSLGTAALIAAAFTGRRSPIRLEPYLPARFADWNGKTD
ncbi:FAD-binding oxidoreductase [Acidobacteria bacterium AB60]|nr:FAD-binding oxidoreductase [Acidobacteria bacterium AB60]